LARKSSIELYNEALRELKSGDRKPVYFLCGPESFFIDQLQKTVEQQVPEDQKDFNFDLIYGNEATVNQVLNIARSYPMMADQRVVIVRDFYALGNGSSANDNGEEAPGSLDQFVGYLEQPNPSCLLLLVSEKTPDGRKKLGKRLKKGDHVGYYEFEEVKDHELPDWIIKWIKTRHDRKINPMAAEVLSQFVGSNLLFLTTEIDKLVTYSEDQEELSAEDVKKVIGHYREYSVFELKDAVMERDLEEALFIAEQMRQVIESDRGEFFKLIGFFYSVFSNIWQILRLRKDGKGKKTIREEMSINPYYFNNLWKDAAHFNLDDMPRIFEALLDADISAKGYSSLDMSGILLFLIERLVGSER